MAKTVAPPDAAAEASKYDSASGMLAGSMPNLVKGVGYAQPGGVAPLEDGAEVLRRSYDAEKAIRKATKDGLAKPGKVVKGLNPAFSSQFGLFLAQGAPAAGAGMAQLTQQLTQVFSELGKNVTLTSPLASGFVPFDLVAPSRLIYPVYSPLRNKIPRVPGQGTSRRTKVVTGISGSQTGASGGAFKRTSISELPNTLNGQNWPLNLPDSGTQDAVDLNVPYKFFGLSESLSWLAQFSGQGFEDISALANLLLLQEFMLSEEAQLLCGRTQALSAPGQPTGTARPAAAGETGLSGVTTDIYVRVTATTLLGESTVSTASAGIATTNGQVVDVTIPHVAGATGYNVYVSTGASDPGAGSSYFMTSTGGAGTVTLQGALPTTGKTASSVTDTSSSANDFDGLIAILTGHADTGAYPSGYKGGYVNTNVGATLGTSVLNTALQQMWNGPGAYRADPTELICEASDADKLSDEMRTQSGGSQAFRFFVEQGELAGVRAGAAVSEVQNPHTRSVMRILVHPWLPQGTTLLMSYTLPFAWSNVSNCWEMTMVQDYLSISWPVIDASFRYSIYEYGALVGVAPQYSGILQGLTTS